MEFASPQRHEGYQESQRGFSALTLENELAKTVVDCAFKIHTGLGPGLLESAYEECMEKEFEKRSIPYVRQYQYPLYYDGEKLNTPFRIDFLVGEKVIIELKSVEKLLPIHEAQVLTYLKLSGLRLALLINFSTPLIKNGIRRFVN